MGQNDGNGRRPSIRPFGRFGRALYYGARSIRSHRRDYRGLGAWDALVVDEFSRIYYEHLNRTWKNTSFLDVKVWKNPIDLWVYQELIVRLRPDLIVETGTARGGSALYLAAVCDLVRNGEIVSIDIAPRAGLPQHPRITYLTGSSTSPAVVEEVTARAAAAGTVLVTLDSDHNRDHVLAELDTYSSLVTTGSYIIVEDTNINGHPVKPRWGPGPREAVEEFLAKTPSFEPDVSCEKFLLTFNPRGFLKRVR